MFRSIVESAGVASHARPGELAFTLKAWLLMPVVETLVASVGVGRTLRCVGRLRLAERRPRSGAVGVERGRVCVRHAAGRHLVRGRCLVRSIVQHALHRLDGMPSTLVVGVRHGSPSAEPTLQAHAWIAARDATASEDAEDGAYRPILVLRADARCPSPAPPS